VITDLKQRFNIKRVVFVGDYGMLSDPNLNFLPGEDLGFIVAKPLRQNANTSDVISVLKKGFDKNSDKEQFGEVVRDGVRFVGAYNPEIASDAKANRRERFRRADAWIREAKKDRKSTRLNSSHRL